MTALIFGAGAQGRVILDILHAMRRYDTIVFADDRVKGQQVNGAAVAYGFDDAIHGSVEAIVALGNPDARLAMAARVAGRGIALLNAIHPSAVVMPTAVLGKGIMVGANAVINSNASIGDHAVINTAAVVEHDCIVEEGAAVSPGARLGGRVHLGSCAFVASGAIVTSRVSIGNRTVVGAGAVVRHDLPASVMAFGVPARVQRTLDSTFDWSRVL